MKRGLLLSAAFMAGACSLSLEVLWTRALIIEAGSPLSAFAIIITSFMAGLTAGTILFGRIADRSRSPLLLFAACQGGIAAAGLVSAMQLTRAGLARPVLTGLHATPGSLFFLLCMALTAGVFVAACATLMGGTIPLLFAAARSNGAIAPGRLLGRISSANAAGAACGSLLTGFLLLPSLGQKTSLLLTSAACLLCALPALLPVIATRQGTHRAPVRHIATYAAGRPERVIGAITPPDLSRPILLVALLISGLALTALELVWSRLVALCFGSSAQAGSLVLAAVIAGLSVGNAAGGRLARAAQRAPAVLGLLAGAAAISVVLTDPLLGRLPLIAAQVEIWLRDSSIGIAGVNSVQFALMFLMAAAPCVLMGALVPVALEAFGPMSHLEGAGVGAVLGAVSMGNLLGAPLALAGYAVGMGSRGCLLAAGGALSVSALLTLQGAFRKWVLALSLVLAFLFARFTGGGTWAAWDPVVMSSGPFLYASLYAGALADSGGAPLSTALSARGEVIFSREGPQALVTVRRQHNGTLSMQVNGKTDASTGGDMKTQKLTSQLPLLLRESLLRAPGGAAEVPPRVMIVGLGSGVSVAAALSHDVASVDIVELSSEVVAAADLFKAANRGALADPRARLTIADARSQLIFDTTDYNIIVSQPSNPWIAGQAILFTREFFSLAMSRLAVDGMMCQWVQGYGLLPEDFRSVVATFASVFPSVSIWEESTTGGDYLLVGSRQPQVIDPDMLARAMAAPSVAADLEEIEIETPADLLSHFVTSGDRAALFTRREQLPLMQTEDRLMLEFTAVRALRSETLGAILASLEPFRTAASSLLAPASTAPELRDELSRSARAARGERTWAAGLGLMKTRDLPDAEMMLGYSYLRAGMTQHATNLVRDLTRRRPADRAARLLLAHLLMNAGEVTGAVKELEAAVALDPSEPRSRLFLARALHAAGRFDEALAANEAAAGLAPDLAEAFSDRCAMLLELEDLPSAQAACLDALAKDSSLAQAHANLGVILARRGRLLEAESSYRRALGLDEGLSDPRYNLAALLGRLGRAAEGLAGLAPGLSEEAQPDTAMLLLAARLALAAGDIDSATQHIERALRAAPGNNEAADLQKELTARRR